MDSLVPQHAAMQPGRVSVIVPSHSHVAHLPEALDAVARQDYADLEIIVVDDGSEQDVPAAIRSVRIDRPLTYVRQEKSGAAAARNLGRARATGEYLAFLDEDDFWESNKISAQVALLTKDTNLGAVFSDGYLVSAVGQRSGRFQARKAFSPCDEGAAISFPSGTLTLETLLKGIVVTSSTLVRASAFDSVGGFAALPSGQDVDFFYRLHRIAGLGYHAAALFSYRLTDGSISRSGIKTLHSSLLVLEHFSRYPITASDRRALRVESAVVERQLGEALFEVGDQSGARQHLLRSLVTYRAWNSRAALLVCATLMPSRLVAALKVMKSGRARSGTLG